MRSQRYQRWLIGLAILLVFGANIRAEQGLGTSDLFTVDTRWEDSSGSGISGLFTVDTRWGFSEGAAVSGFFTVDTRLSGSASATASGLFTVDTMGATVGSVLVAGRVTDTAGNGLSGTTVRAFFFNRIQASALSDASGYYTLPVLPAGTYELRAAKANYITGIRAFQSFSPGQSATINYSLAVLPAPPAIEVVNRDPQSAPLPPTPANLKVWVVGTWQNAPLDPGKITIVLTHGWRSSDGTWPTTMAEQLSTGPNNVASQANIVAWDWQNDAKGMNLNNAYSRTPIQGEARALALSQSLQAAYTKEFHFIGHSLGTLVNAKAANDLHKNSYPYERTHMTLFDNAVLANIGGPLEEAALAGALGGADAATISLAISTSRLLQRGWVSPIPDYARWIDNYISLVGVPYARAVNVSLANGPIFASSYGLVGLHGYSYEWYGATAVMPLGSLLGHRYSFERQTTFSDSFPYAANSYFVQDNLLNGTSLRRLDTSKEIDNFQALLLLTIGRVTVTEVTSTVQGAVRTVGNVVVKTLEVSRNAFQRAIDASLNNLLIGPGFLFENATPLNVASLRIELKTMPSDGSLFRGGKSRGDNSTNIAAYVWMTVAIPSNAVSMSFDFEVHGEGKGDTLLFGINGTNQFALETRFIPLDAGQNSGAIDVRQWAGTDAEFFFGLTGGTSTNALIALEGIRFYAEVGPTLQAAIDGSDLVLKWPVSASGYTLEASSNLVAGSWIEITNAPTIVDFQNVMTNDLSIGNRFYRLRK